MFVICIPIQLFLHMYLSNAVKNKSFNGIAGFDDRTEYNMGQQNVHCGYRNTASGPFPVLFSAVDFVYHFVVAHQYACDKIEQCFQTKFRQSDEAGAII